MAEVEEYDGVDCARPPLSPLLQSVRDCVDEYSDTIRANTLEEGGVFQYR